MDSLLEFATTWKLNLSDTSLDALPFFSIIFSILLEFILTPSGLPVGAVNPATNPTIGFFILWFFTNSAASSSAVPPISPIIKIDFVSSSFKKRSKQSIKFVPFIGSPPIPIQVVCPNPFSVVWATAS